MNGTPKVVIAALVSSMSFATSQSWAQANAPPDPEGASAGLLVGWAFQDAYKFGIGARGGYTLPQKVYVGGTFVYHTGNSQSQLGITVDEHLFYLGAEGGYDFVIPSAPQVLVRPYLGLGFESVSVSSSGTLGGINFSGSQSINGFAFWPGATGLYFFTPNISAGVDARVIVDTFSGGNTAFALSLTGQYKF
jgi:hypothetical protein